MEKAIRDLIGEATVTPGKVKLELPPIVENGNTVSLSVSVDSPMTEAEHVASIHLFNEKNPQPYIAIIGACVIASWSYGLIRDTGAVLLDLNPDRRMADNLRRMIEAEGDALGDLHLWRLGPGHLGAIISVITQELRGPEFYRAKLARFRSLSHLTIEVQKS